MLSMLSPLSTIPPRMSSAFVENSVSCWREHDSYQCSRSYRRELLNTIGALTRTLVTLTLAPKMPRVSRALVTFAEMLAKPP